MLKISWWTLGLSWKKLSKLLSHGTLIDNICFRNFYLVWDNFLITREFFCTSKNQDLAWLISNWRKSPLKKLIRNLIKSYEKEEARDTRLSQTTVMHLASLDVLGRKAKKSDVHVYYNKRLIKLKFKKILQIEGFYLLFSALVLVIKKSFNKGDSLIIKIEKKWD